MNLTGLLKRLCVAFIFLVLGYSIFLLLLTVPSIQRNALYAHKVNPTYFEDISDVEQFGFYHHQVQPFTLTTPDNVTIHAWHILPVQLYVLHESALTSQPDFGVKHSSDALETVGFQVLLNDPNAYVVVSFHGNAAHLASAQRPQNYQQLLGVSMPDRAVHVIAFDYRGFGLSTGSPTEEGVITDALTVMSFLTGIDIAARAADVDAAASSPSQAVLSSPPVRSLSIPPSRIILLGQSLGTFVSAALYHHWTLTLSLPAPRALIVLASFTSLPSLLDSYSIKGLIPPLLSPLNHLPSFISIGGQTPKSWLLSHLADQWDTSSRLRALTSPSASAVPLDLTIMHAADDWEIPVAQGWANFLAATTAHSTIDGSPLLGQDMPMTETKEWRSVDNQHQPVRKSVRWEKLRHGGHNRVAVAEQVRAAVWRILADASVPG